jgi:hypothetical protein
VGNLFDITTFGNDLTVKALEVDVDTTSTFTLEVYGKSGTYVGAENNSSAWTLLSSTTGTGQGRNNPSLVDITDFNLSANSLTGIYVNYINATRINYINGNGTNQSYANSDLQLNLGIAKSELFGGSTFSPRVWNGTVIYDINATAVPEPVTILGSLVALGIGTAMKRKSVSKN